MDVSTPCTRYKIVCRTRCFVFGLVMVVALSACAVSSGRTSEIAHEGNANVKTQNAGTTTADLRAVDLLIVVEKQQWKIGGPIPVKLRVHNAGKVPIGGICSFSLIDPTAGDDPFKEGRNLWAPVVVQEGLLRPAQAIQGETASSRLNPGETTELEVDLNKLVWAKVIQNVWPESTFSQTAAAGDFEVSFRMNVRIGETSERIESNKVKVSIK